MCEKTRKEMVEETQENLFYTLDKTLLLIGSIGSNFVEKNLWNEWEKLALRVSKNLAQNNDKTLKFIGKKNIAVGVCQACRSTGLVDRQRSEIRPLEPRSPLGSTEPLEQRVNSLSVDPYGRPRFPESRALWGLSLIHI